MHRADVFTIFTGRLEAAEVEYFVTGSVASIIYGEPRMTHDIDLVVDCDESGIDDLLDAFPEEEFYRPPRPALLREVRREQRGHFNVIHHETGYKADCYLVGDEALHHWALEHRRRIDLGEGNNLWVAPPEYVILRKLQYYRESEYEKHVRDIAGMLEISEDDINFEGLKKRISQFGLESVWDEVQGDEENGETPSATDDVPL